LQVAEERPVERVPPHPRRYSAYGDALGGHDELAALRQGQPFRIETERRVGLPVRRTQRRHTEEVNVTVVEAAVGEIDTKRVEPRRVELALVVRQAVEDAVRSVIGDARKAADRRSGEAHPRRDDRLAEELQAGWLRAVAGVRCDRAECGHRQRGHDSDD
jgi:hypothetical protein